LQKSEPEVYTDTVITALCAVSASSSTIRHSLILTKYKKKVARFLSLVVNTPDSTIRQSIGFAVSFFILELDIEFVVLYVDIVCNFFPRG
jgi:hypothetical protein